MGYENSGDALRLSINGEGLARSGEPLKNRFPTLESGKALRLVRGMIICIPGYTHVTQAASPELLPGARSVAAVVFYVITHGTLTAATR
eukprot:3934944-Rhodomonas_salina.7